MNENAIPCEKLDRAGMVASTACAIHCALLPLVVTFLPLVGLGFLASESMEWALLGVSAILGALSICYGYRLHRSRKALAWLATGLALLVVGRLLHGPHHHHHHHEHAGLAADTLILVLGGFVVAGAHWLNHRLCKSCVRCHPSV